MFRHQLSALALVAACAFPLAASADTAPNTAPVVPGAAAPAAAPGQHHERRGIMRAMRGLQLTPAQKQQIKDMVQSTRAANQGADRPTRKANRIALQHQIDGVLTDTQRTRFHANLARLQQQRMQANPAAPQSGPQAPPQ